MQTEIINRETPDGVMRQINVEVDNNISVVKFKEDGELQLILTIQEDVINLETSKLKKRKYVWIFAHYLENGISEMSVSELAKVLYNDYYRRNEIKYVARIIVRTKDGYELICGGSSYSAQAYIEEKIKGVDIKYNIDICSRITYSDLQNSTKEDLILNNNCKVTIACEQFCNNYNEWFKKIIVNGIPYVLTNDMYSRISRPEYIKRHLFEGNGIFTITAEQRKEMAIKKLISNEYNFIKYVGWDGTVLI